MRDDKLENQLRPGPRAGFGDPVRQGVGRHLRDEVALPEGAIDDDGDLALCGERQDAVLHIAVQDIVSYLDEVDRLRHHDIFDFRMAASLRGGDADIFKLAGVLHCEERLEMLFPAQQIVDLKQIELRHTPKALGLPDLLPAGLRIADPDLVGGKQRLRPRQLFKPVSDRLLGRTIHWRGIDQPSSCSEEGLHDRSAFISQLHVVPDVESDPASEADDGKFFSG